MKRTFRLFVLALAALAVVLSFAACSTGGFADPDADVTVKDTGVLSRALTLSEDGKTLAGVVAYDTEVFSFARDITLAHRARMSVYTDEACTVKVPKKVTLSSGDNVYYLRVTNGPSSAVYRAVIRRGEKAVLAFNTGDAFLTYAEQNETVGMKPASLPLPAWEGHLFTGWYTDPECTTPFTADDAVSGDAVLYAGWKPGPGGRVCLNYLCDGKVYASMLVPYGEPITFPVPPASDEDRLFAGWLDENGEPVDPTVPVTDHATFTAFFITEKHTVTYLYEGETLHTDTVFYGMTAAEAAAPSVTDPVAFLGWYEEGGALPFDFTAGIDRDVTLYARFTSPDFTRTASFTVTLPVTEEAKELFDSLFPDGTDDLSVNVARIFRHTVAGVGEMALSADFSVRVDRGGRYTFGAEMTSDDGSYTAALTDEITSDTAVVITGSLHLGVALTDETRDALSYAEMLGDLLGDIDFGDRDAAEAQIRFIISLIFSQIGGAGDGETL